MQPKDCEFWISVTIALYALKVLFSWSAMNDFPVIGDPVMCTGFWDQQGANIASRLKELYNLKFSSPLKAIFYLMQEGVLIDRIYRINHTETYNLSAATLVTFALHKIMTKCIILSPVTGKSFICLEESKTDYDLILIQVLTN